MTEPMTKEALSQFLEFEAKIVLNKVLPFVYAQLELEFVLGQQVRINTDDLILSRCPRNIGLTAISLLVQKLEELGYTVHTQEGNLTIT